MTAVLERVGYAQLAFDLEGISPAPAKCTDGGWTHRLSPCGHCERCGSPLLSIMGELSKLCPGHQAVAA